MEPLTRRQVLQLGALGGLGVVVGGAGLARVGAPWTPRRAAPGSASGSAGQELVEPEVLRSTNGRLQVQLAAENQDVVVAGRRARVLAYNGSVPGQTWRIRPGDRIDVRLENRLETPTNLHTHGLFVSPQGSSDNALLSIGPGETFDYGFELPRDHPTGVFWYHPHRHGYVADQVFAGMYGAMVVEDDDVEVARERVLVISDISLTPDGAVRGITPPERMAGREGDLVLVNGQLSPEISARPGEQERWRVVNACTSRYLRLALPGQQLRLLGIDSGHEAAPREVDDVVLAPGNRADLLVAMSTGTAELRTLGYDRGEAMMGMMSGQDLSGPRTLATVTVTGAAADDARPDDPVRAARRGTEPDLRPSRVDARRELTFTMGGMGGMGGMAFGFDGRSFDPERIDQRVATDAVEEWTIRNPTPMNHPFHLHVWPMQLIQVNSTTLTDPTWRDVVDVPAGGHVVVRIRFTRFAGSTVYHCHVLDHEDAGMMGIVAADAT